jgi:hypothetical protein
VHATAALTPQKRRRSDGDRAGIARPPARSRRHPSEPEAPAPETERVGDASADPRLRLVEDRPSRVRLVNDRLVTNRTAKSAAGSKDGAAAGAKPTPARAAKPSLPSWLQSYRSPE